ncbi:conserved protein, unknown function, partial [Hepatocystis sp. ex Piliocolobus tephrosceles]
KSLYPDVCHHFKRMHIPIKKVNSLDECTVDEGSYKLPFSDDEPNQLYKLKLFKYDYYYFAEIPVSFFLENFCSAIKINDSECKNMYSHINEKVKGNPKETINLLKTCMGSYYYEEAKQLDETYLTNTNQQKKNNEHNKKITSDELLQTLSKSITNSDDILCKKTYNQLKLISTESFIISESIPIKDDTKSKSSLQGNTTNSKRSNVNENAQPALTPEENPIILAPSHQGNDTISESSYVNNNVQQNLTLEKKKTETEISVQGNTTISKLNEVNENAQPALTPKEKPIILAPSHQGNDTISESSATISNLIYGVFLLILTIYMF